MSTAIEWTDETWNPVVGCTKVSQGCKNCYAKTLHDLRHKAHANGKRVHPQYARPFEVIQLMPDRLETPLHWRAPRRVFVNSVSDLFHEHIPDAYIVLVFQIMGQTPRHTYQILTKRPERMKEWIDRFRPTPLSNVWLGVSVENQEAADERIPLLIDTPAAVRFLSCEPLLGAIDFEWLPLRSDWQTPSALLGIDWVIVGGESGAKARPCNLAWIEWLVDQCRAASVACFVKQLGSVPVEEEARWCARIDQTGIARVLSVTNRTKAPPACVALKYGDKKGGDPLEWPLDLRVREFPQAAAVPA